MSAQDNNSKVGQTDNLKIAYQELCSSYHAIDDFRTKLLGFLPLATGTGLFLLLGNFKDVNKLDFCTPETRSFLIAVGVFWVMITLGLFAYEIYGIKKCTALIHVGRCIERSLLEHATHIDDGPFGSRPQNVAPIINEPFAAAIIYSI